MGMRKVQEALCFCLVNVAGYMQMTQEQVEDWSNSPDQYVADEEEETFSVRVSGELVLDELMAAFPEPAVAAVASAVQCRLQEAAQAKVSERGLTPWTDTVN